MPTLTINGKRVKVDDSFLSLSPEEQDATVDEIARSMGGGGSPRDEMSAISQSFTGGPEQYAPAIGEARTERKANELADLQERVAGRTGAGELFGNSFVLGLQDKVAGLAEGVGNVITGRGGFGEGYEVGRRAQEIQEERARQRSGGWGKAAEIGGAVASGVLAKAPAAASTVGRIIQGGKEAGILGLFQGFGDSNADTVGGLVGDTLTGGATSAGFGAGATGIMELGRGLLKGGRAAYRGLTSVVDDEPGRAARKVYQSLADDGVTPQQAAARMRTRNTALINAGDENTLGLGRAAAAKPGPGRTTLNRALDAQQRGSGARVVGAADSALGAPGSSFGQRMRLMIDARAKTGNRQYENAFLRNFERGHAPIFDDLAKRVPGDAVRNGMKIAHAEGRPFGEQLVASIDDLGNVKFRRAPSLREWHYIQRGLRSAADNAYRSGVGEVGTAYKALHRQILSAMDKSSPLYKAARSQYATQSQLMEALEKGREILNPATTRNVDTLVDDLAGMSASERELVRAGLARQIQDMIEATPDAAGDMVRKIFGTEGKRKAIQAAFDNVSDFRRFEAEMGRIARETKTFRYVRTGSRTSIVDAEKQNAGILADAASAAADVVTGGVGGVTGTAIRGTAKILRDMGGMDQGVAEQVAKLLVERDPNRVLQALSPSINRTVRQTATDELLRKARVLLRAGSAGMSAEMGTQAIEQRR